MRHFIHSLLITTLLLATVTALSGCNRSRFAREEREDGNLIFNSELASDVWSSWEEGRLEQRHDHGIDHNRLERILNNNPFQAEQTEEDEEDSQIWADIRTESPKGQETTPPPTPIAEPPKGELFDHPIIRAGLADEEEEERQEEATSKEEEAVVTPTPTPSAPTPKAEEVTIPVVQPAVTPVPPPTEPPIVKQAIIQESITTPVKAKSKQEEEAEETPAVFSPSIQQAIEESLQQKATSPNTSPTSIPEVKSATEKNLLQQRVIYEVREESPARKRSSIPSRRAEKELNRVRVADPKIEAQAEQKEAGDTTPAAFSSIIQQAIEESIQQKDEPINDPIINWFEEQSTNQVERANREEHPSGPATDSLLPWEDLPWEDEDPLQGDASEERAEEFSTWLEKWSDDDSPF